MGLPVRAAVISGVSPSGEAVFGLAPAFKSSSTSFALALVHANDSAVTL